MFRIYVAIKHLKILSILLVGVIILLPQIYASGVTNLSMQAFTVQGKITTSAGNALSGVEVKVAGKDQAVYSNTDGKYKIQANKNALLTFSKEGYQRRQLEVLGRNRIDIELKPGTQGLNDLVTSSLGIEKKSGGDDASISEIKGDELVQADNMNLREILTRIVKSVNQNQKQEDKNQSRVIIRGNTALSNTHQPLYVIDGNPVDSNNSGAAGMWGEKAGGVELDKVTPKDIATIRVLQGAKAKELYGSRAKNGVIEIVTKKGQRRSGN